MNMLAHWRYFKYVARHKWYVYLGCRIVRVSFWQALIHDLSKFRPSEWNPYVEYFYARPSRPIGAGVTGYMHKPGDDDAFDYAWLLHQHRNPHHWQHWCLRRDTGEYTCLPMPNKYAGEMVADWYGAGMAQGKPDIRAWYAANRDKIILHPDTRAWVDMYLERLPE